MMAITTNNSMSVKADERRRAATAALEREKDMTDRTFPGRRREGRIAGS